jgi:putative ABC transport system permease protein
MSAATTASRQLPLLRLPVAVRLAFRELRTGLSGFYVFVACIALGVAAIAGVGSLAGVLQSSLAQQGQRILGGDFSAGLVHRQATQQERAFLAAQGTVGEVATMRAMARSSDGQYTSLIDVTAVDDAYPLYGKLVLAAPGGAPARQELGAPGVAAADAGLLTRFDIKLGDTVKIGDATVKIIATIGEQPDRLSGRPALGPRVLMSLDTLKTTGLVQPGSLIRWWYRVRFDDALAGGVERLKSLRQTVEERFSASGFSLRDRADPAPNIARAIDRFSQFLTLVGVTTLMIGGVGVANAIATYLARKRDVIATFKCLGASSRTIFATYLIQVLVLAAVGTAIGLLLGSTMPPLIAWAYGDVLPLKLALSVQPSALAMASLYGLLTALLFVLWPLGRARDQRAARLLRETVSSERAWPAPEFIAAAAFCGLALAAIAIGSSYAKMLAFYACLALVFCFAVYLALGSALQWGARRMAPPRIVELALARAGLAAPGGLARPVALSLGTGLSLLTAVALVNAALVSEFRTSIPKEAPSYYVLDIDKAQIEPFEALIAEQSPQTKVVTAPILRGRIIELDGVSTDKIDPPENVRWVLNGDRGLTFASTKPENSELVAGQWWPQDYAGPPLVSFAAKIAKDLGLGVGDGIVVNVLGRRVQAKIANLRTVDWDSLAINFVMVFSPNALESAPYKLLATLAVPQETTVSQEESMIQAISKAFPNLTAIRVQDAIEALLGVVAQIMVAVRAAGGLTLLVGAVVLAGALATAHRRRMHDAVIFKTLGATRRRIVLAHMAEYVILAIVAGAAALCLGTLAAYLIVTNVMDAQFSFSAIAAAQPILLAVGLVMAFGAFATLRVLAAETTPQLRAE